ncbi:hypothetical protein RHMOL_Rhmol04G0336300 [Rhododendron molle]|uniref:Uncharacterized protein n=1 Tax=Rhododendron molle TaxID=49168 RepID=A0ACC0P8N2_RHOML|nr:hypothetical protein RHMOL_Rhmol04G0336300 [Rhododendron molle]
MIVSHLYREEVEMVYRGLIKFILMVYPLPIHLVLKDFWVGRGNGGCALFSRPIDLRGISYFQTQKSDGGGSKPMHAEFNLQQQASHHLLLWGPIVRKAYLNPPAGHLFSHLYREIEKVAMVYRGLIKFILMVYPLPIHLVLKDFRVGRGKGGCALFSRPIDFRGISYFLAKKSDGGSKDMRRLKGDPSFCKLL